MSQENCPKCSSTYIYEDGAMWVCPDCAYEWVPSSSTANEVASDEVEGPIKDANGNELSDGDSVIVIKELKIKGAANSLKSGTKVRNIRLLQEAEDGHNISCKVDGIGSINLKSQYVRKA
jgi:protein PhnA